MLMKVSPQVNELNRRLDDKTATVGVCGLGYVGLPLAVATAGAGFRVIGFDIDEAKTRALNGGTAMPGSLSIPAMSSPATGLRVPRW